MQGLPPRRRGCLACPATLPGRVRLRHGSRRNSPHAKRHPSGRGGALVEPAAARATAEQAARGVGSSRSTLFRWAETVEPRSRRPHHVRPKTWTSALVAAVVRIRDDNPMWGKQKIVVLLAREGIATSASTVGRILKSLMDRGVVTPVPTLRRKPGGRRFRIIGQERHARRLPKGLKPSRPGDLVQVDTLFVNVAPNVAVKHFTA